jgi:hypothetical protein
VITQRARTLTRRCIAGPLYIPGVDDEEQCASERAHHWQRHAAVVRSTCTGSERTSLRVLCTSTSAPSSQHDVAPHCIQIVISPKPASAPASMELCVRWVALAVRESRASNASCLGLLLDYISSMILLTKVCTPQHAPHAPPPSDALLTSPGAEVQPPARSLASRCPRHCQIVHHRRTLTPSSAGITSALRDRLHSHTAMTTEGWSSVRQLILLRTKRKAAEAALNSFMLTTADCSRGQPQQQSAPLSTLVLNCFVDVIGQQVQPAVNPRPKIRFAAQ